MCLPRKRSVCYKSVMSSDNGRTRANDFPETADIETSSADYAKRFEGSVGEWFLEVQGRTVLSWIVERPSAVVLDVGGGHGQLAHPLCRAGYPVTVLGSSQDCGRRIADLIGKGQCTFKVGNVVEIPFPDRSFDTVLCFRLLPHCARWPQLISELCRVANREVIADYPTSRSLNAVAPLLFGAKKKIEKNTREWTMFRDRDVCKEFEAHGFMQRRKKGEFFLPMVLHRALRCRSLSVALEGCCRMLGLTGLFGSPVIVEMVRERD